MDPISQNSVPWVEKYRPDQLDKMYGHQEILNTIQRFMIAGQIPNLLLHGPAGTGKTTAAVAICKQIFGASHYKMSTLELNASDDRGIDVIRDRVKQFAQTSSFASFTFKGEDEREDKINNEAHEGDNDNAKTQIIPENVRLIRKTFKFVVLDECDSMTQQAQFALRRMIEQFSYNVRFFIICNYANKIIPALVSRCTSFRFAVLPEQHTSECLHNVAKHENIDLNPAAIQAFQRVSKGDLRKTLNLLQSLVIMERAKVKVLKTDSNGDNNASNRVSISDKSVYRALGEITPTEARNIVKKLLSSNNYSEMMDLLISHKNKSNLCSMLPALYEAFSMIEYKTLDQRLRIMEGLAKVELRFSQGSNQEELEAGYLVNQILMFRNMVQAGGG